jgi:acyl-CoA synthetase (NDP forming)
LIKNQIINEARKQGRTLLSEIESKEILKEAGINTTSIKLALDEKEAISISENFGYPVVLKIASPDITHKSDAGGVKVGLKNAAEVSRAYQEIMASVRLKFPAARIDGVSVQNMARPGVEIIIGMTKDAQFGPVLMFGLGGIWVEVLKDVSFRIVPLTRKDAAEMIKEIRGAALLKGYRNSEPVNTTILEDMLLKLSGFLENTPEIKEMDLNPVFAYSDGAIAVDARIVLDEITAK